MNCPKLNYGCELTCVWYETVNMRGSCDSRTCNVYGIVVHRAIPFPDTMTSACDRIRKHYMNTNIVEVVLHVFLFKLHAKSKECPPTPT